MRERIRLAGRTRKPWEELAVADLFVMTSRVEGFPNVLLEAMALERPCVALDCPNGPREMTEDGRYALLVPLDDDHALVDALTQLMSDSTLRQAMGRRAGAHVRQLYSIEHILASWDTVFNKVRSPQIGQSEGA
jgi:glycosyltransferase involved in cell wall biosynthesis